MGMVRHVDGVEAWRILGNEALLQPSTTMGLFPDSGARSSTSQKRPTRILRSRPGRAR